MDLGLVIIDVAVAFIMFWILTLFTAIVERGVPMGFSVFIASSITFLVMIVFSSIRYPIFLLLVSIYGLIHLMEYIRVIRPENSRLQQRTAYYGQQLSTHLQDYQPVYVKLYADEPVSKDRATTHLHLFIASKPYYALIYQQEILNPHWEIIQLTSSKDYPNQIFILLLLNYANRPSIALPFFAGEQREGKTSYDRHQSWRPALSSLATSAQLTLYPIEEKYFKTQKILKNTSDYCAEMSDNKLETSLFVPSVSHDILQKLWGQKKVEIMLKPPRRDSTQLQAYSHRSMKQTIQPAIDLSTKT